MSDIILIDAQNLAFRLFFSAMKRKSVNGGGLSFNGKETSIIFGFTQQIASLLGEHQGCDLVVCWDSKSKRRLALTDLAKKSNLIESGYKEERKGLGEEDKVSVETQVAHLRTEIIPAFAVMQVCVEGYEADDVIYSYAKRYQDRKCYIISSDRDFYQTLTSPNVTIIDAMNKRTWNKEIFTKEYGFDPCLYVDYGAIIGEGKGGDNIPGVPGCGDKTAKKLVRQYGNTASIISGLTAKQPRDSKEESLLNNLPLLDLSLKLKQMDYIEGLPEIRISPTSEEEAKKVIIAWGCISLLKKTKLLCRGEQN